MCLCVIGPSVVFDRFMMEEQFGWRVSETPEAFRLLDTRFALLAGSSSESIQRRAFLEADL
jgi:hypothetical protein